MKSKALTIVRRTGIHRALCRTRRRQGAQVGADIERAERLAECGREPATHRGGRARSGPCRGRGLDLRSVQGGVVDARECLLAAMTATGLGSVGPLGAGHGLSWCASGWVV